MFVLILKLITNITMIKESKIESKNETPETGAPEIQASKPVLRDLQGVKERDIAQPFLQTSNRDA